MYNHYLCAFLILCHYTTADGFSPKNCSSRINHTYRLFNCNETFDDSLGLERDDLDLEEGPKLDQLLSLLPAFAPITAKNDKCRADSQTFLRELRDMKLWAMQMYDSTAKAGSGLLNGNIVLLGDYDQCLAVERGGDEAISGKYCVATVYMEAVEKSPGRIVHQVVDLMQSHGAMRNSYEDDMRFLPTFNPISWAFCVPSSCEGSDLEDSLTDLLRPFNQSSGLDLKVVVTPGACVDKHSNPLDLAAVATALFLASFVLLALWGTLHERSNTALDGQLTPAATRGTFARVLLAFSFRRNSRLLLDTDVPEDELGCVHGLRAIASFFIYVIHRSVFAMFYPFSNRTQVAELLEGDWTMMFRAFWNWVDSFVVLSGLLTSFYAFKRLQEGKKLNLPRMYLQRYIKFTPMLFIMSLATQNLLGHLVTGPQLIRVIDHYVQNCKRSLLPVVTYTNVFEGFENMCYPPSHQLATDMHMYLMAPFFILTIWRWPRGGPAAILGLMGVLAAMKYSVVYAENLGSFLYYGISIKTMVVSANMIYINAVHRLTPYLFGLGLGYILRRTDSKCNLTRVQMAAGTALAMAGAVYSIYGVAHVARRGYVYDAREAAAFAVVQPVFWSFALCWLVYCCATQQAPGWIRRFLTWRGFVVFSRLSYAVYLVQLYVIAVGVGQVMTSEYFRITKLVDLNEISAVCILSLLCTLLFLLPLQDLWAIATRTYVPPVYKTVGAKPTVDAGVTSDKPKVCQD